MADCSRKRKTRRCLQRTEKLKILSELQRGTRVEDIAKKYDISIQQAYKIVKAKHSLTELKNGLSMHSKILVSRAKYPDIDRSVFEWFCSIRAFRGRKKPLPISRELVKARAIYEAKIRNITNFKVSDGWFSNWRWRYNISKCVRLHGEAGDIDLEAAELEMKCFRDLLVGYDVKNIFNMDEAGLFFRAIPSHSYYIKDSGDPRQINRGSKAMKAKERLTIILCTGEFKLEPVIIGSAKKPRCFKDSPSPLPYFHQKNSWNDRVNFDRWWKEVFLPKIRLWTKEPVALILDGFSGHSDDCNDPLGQVKLIKLPPNVTSIYQPLDQGIIAVLKARYICTLLGKMVQVAEVYSAQLEEMANKLPAGCAGLSYGCPPHVGDAIAILKDCWDSVSSTVIASCWRHSNCLHASEITDLTSSSEEYHKKLESDTIADMCDKLAHLVITNPVRTMLKTTGLDVVVDSAQTIAADMLKEWLNIEESNSTCFDESLERPLDDSFELDETPPSVDKVQLLNRALVIIKDLHDIGIQLNDDHLMNGAVELCSHIASHPVNSTSV